MIYPVYGSCDYLTAAELKHVRALYAGEVTLADRWVGLLLEKIEDLGLLENTAIIFSGDHGFYHGEHGLIGKCIITATAQVLCLLYEEVTCIPLFIRLCGLKAGWRCQAFVQPPDIMLTILELAEAEDPGTMHGKSLVPLLQGQKSTQWPDFVITSPFLLFMVLWVVSV